MKMKMSLLVLEIWLFDFGKVLEILFKGVCRNPVIYTLWNILSLIHY